MSVLVSIKLVTENVNSKNVMGKLGFKYSHDEDLDLGVDIPRYFLEAPAEEEKV